MAGERKIETEIEIDASPEAVWEALSSAEGLKRWFGLDARVRPGQGGSIWLSWGEGADWESPIEIWEPGRHLRTVDEVPGKDGAPPARVAVDYLIETREGRTLVRLVHSGMAADSWDDEIDTLNAGWNAFLIHLRHSLEAHPGQPRQLAHFRHPAVSLERPEAFRRTLRVLGIDDPSQLQVGGRYASSGVEAIRLSGEVRLLKSPINLTATVESLNDGMLMIEIEPGRGRCRPSVWLSLYGESGRQAVATTTAIRKLLESEFIHEMAE